MTEFNLEIYKERFPCLKEFERTVSLKEGYKSVEQGLAMLCNELPILEILNLHLELVERIKYYIPFHSNKNRIIILANDEYELSAFYNMPAQKYFVGKVLHSYNNDTYFCPTISYPKSKYVMYEQSFTDRDDLLNENFKLKIIDEGEIIRGKTIFVKKFKNVIRFDKTIPFVSYVLVSKLNSSSYSWEYDSKTLLPKRISLLDVNIARIATTCKVLGRIGNSNSTNLLIRLCDHNSHLIRWEAVRSLVNINFEQGVEKLIQMKRDNHIEVQNAAKKSLELLNK